MENDIVTLQVGLALAQFVAGTASAAVLVSAFYWRLKIRTETRHRDYMAAFRAIYDKLGIPWDSDDFRTDP